MRSEFLHRSIGRHILLGGVTLGLVCGSFGLWAATTDLAGAVIATGQLVVEGSSKKVQHPTGGVVAEIYVREGQKVQAGQAVLRLDGTVARASLAVVANSLNQLYARLTRLEAERDNLTSLSPSPALLARLKPEQLEPALTGERRLFEARIATRAGQKNQLKERTTQLKEKIAGLRAEQGSKTLEIGFIDQEMTGVRSLYQKGLAPMSRLNNLERAAARLQGERGQLISAVAEAQSAISETEIQLLQVDQTIQNEVAAELRDVVNRIEEMTEREIAALDQLKRLDVLAPVSGIVHQLTMHTVGGVVPQGSDLMQIMPDQTALTIEARIAPQDIDQMLIGQEARLRLVAFNRNTTPELLGTLTRISPDLITDERRGTSFYRGEISFKPGEQDKVNDMTLVAGMPVEAYIRTSDRTVLSYLTKPLRDHAARAFRED